MPKFMGRQLWYIGMEFVQFFHKGAKNAVGPVVGLVCISLGTVDDLFGQDHFLPKCYRFWNLTQTLPKCIINNRDCPLPELVFQTVTFHYMLSCISGKIGYKSLMDIDTAVFCINIGPPQPQQLAPGDSGFQHQHQRKPKGVFFSKGNLPHRQTYLTVRQAILTAFGYPVSNLFFYLSSYETVQAFRVFCTEHMLKVIYLAFLR